MVYIHGGCTTYVQYAVVQPLPPLSLVCNMCCTHALYTCTCKYLIASMLCKYLIVSSLVLKSTVCVNCIVTRTNITHYYTIIIIDVCLICYYLYIMKFENHIYNSTPTATSLVINKFSFHCLSTVASRKQLPLNGQSRSAIAMRRENRQMAKNKIHKRDVWMKVVDCHTCTYLRWVFMQRKRLAIFFVPILLALHTIGLLMCTKNLV